MALRRRRVRCADHRTKKPARKMGTKGRRSSESRADRNYSSPITPPQCDRCHRPLPLAEALVVERGQVFDVPARSFDVIEHCTLEVACSCGLVYVSAFPADVSGQAAPQVWQTDTV